ncbi:MAG TPA: hypothetical protein V6C81_10850 [Planktothrix sp.]|jgi:hypothetical protein
MSEAKGFKTSSGEFATSDERIHSADGGNYQVGQTYTAFCGAVAVVAKLHDGYVHVTCPECRAIIERRNGR